jgi:predicted Ser/Thr protein kinase
MPIGDSAPLLDPELSALETALGAQYAILRPLGRGGMGAVYLARERLLERLVAIKVLHRVDAESHERFLREARAAARLTHPNIVPLHSFGQAGDTVFYVMGYVEGESLESLLRRSVRLPVTESARILSELAGALDFAHRNGVVHRDVKPDNVMIEQGTGRVVLTDFGIARIESSASLTQTGVIVGTPQYMSPEQAAGDRIVDGRSDLYSLGVIGYRMVAGRLPFESASARELLAHHITRRPAALTSLVADAPLSLSTAIMRCLEKSPDARFATGADMRASLGTSLGDEYVLPDGLEHLPSHGWRILTAAWAADLLFVSAYAASGKLQWLALAAGTAIATLPIGASTILVAKRMGVAPRRTWQLLFTAPAFWAYAWPRALRRPGDVWDSLPREIQRVKRWLAAFFVVAMPVGLMALIPIMVHASASDDVPAALRLMKFTVAVYSLPLLSVIPLHVRLRRWAKRTGISFRLATKLVGERTWGSRFWQRPDITALLDTSSTTRDREAPSSAPALVAAVVQLATGLESLDASLAAQVRDAARDLAAAIRNFERDLGELAAHLDPAEASRIEERVEALGPARADEGDAASQMRRVLTDQLALIHDLSRRYAALDERRGQALERLRSLWMHLQGLRARQAMQDADGAEITARIRAACANVAHLNAAFDEVNALTHGPVTTPVP